MRYNLLELQSKVIKIFANLSQGIYFQEFLFAILAQKGQKRPNTTPHSFKTSKATPIFYCIFVFLVCYSLGGKRWEV